MNRPTIYQMFFTTIVVLIFCTSSFAEPASFFQQFKQIFMGKGGDGVQTEVEVQKRTGTGIPGVLEYGNIPLYFIPNEGQVSERALFP